MKMKILSMVAVLALIARADADTLVLKDGRLVEWRTISDKGDFYEVVTPSGTTTTVKKSDVEKFEKGNMNAPLVGATFSLDKTGKAVKYANLLSSVDVSRDIVYGKWRISKEGLRISPGEGHSLLQTTFVPPDEYDLSAVIQRDGGDGDVSFGLVGGGKRFSVHFYDKSSGPAMIDGKHSWERDFASVPGKFFENGTSRKILIMVRKESLAIIVDGKDFLSWKADWNRVSLHPHLAVRSKDVISVGSYLGNASILSLTITVPKEDGKADRSAKPQMKR